MTKSLDRFYQELVDEQYFTQIALDPLAQFGSESQALIGATLIPERLVEANSYVETQVRYRTLPALDATRYSPAQMQKSGHLVGELKVDLGHTDTASELTGQDHDGMIKLLENASSTQATANAIDWVNRTLIRPHIIKNEAQRWQAMALGSVARNGSNGYLETVSYHQESGHVLTIPGGTVGVPAGWHDPAYDIMADVSAAQQVLEDKGYMVRGVYSTGKLISLMQQNTEIAKRTSRVVVDATGQITAATGRVTFAELNAIAQEDGLPSFTKYNAGYETANGFKRYLDVADDADYMVFVGSTNRMWDMATDYVGYTTGTAENVFVDGAFDPLEGVLGYYGVGRNVGQGASGRTVMTELQTRKPQGLYGEAYQAGLPVILEPQALCVIKVVRPTP